MTHDQLAIFQQRLETDGVRAGVTAAELWALVAHIKDLRDALRFLNYQAADCRNKDTHEALCLLLPALMNVNDILPMNGYEAENFRRGFRCALNRKAEAASQVEQVIKDERIAATRSVLAAEHERRAVSQASPEHKDTEGRR